MGGTGSGDVILNGSIRNDVPGFRRGISGAGSLTKQGSFTVFVNPAGDFTGGTTINQGTIVLGDPAALGTGAVQINAGGTLNAAGTNPANDVTLNGGILYMTNATSGTITLNDVAGNQIFATGNYRVVYGQITGAGGFTVGGVSTPGVALANPANDFLGDVTVNGGSYLRLNASEVIPDTADVTNNGYLRFEGAGRTETIGGLSGGGNLFEQGGNATLRVGANDASGSYAGTTGASWDAGARDIALVKIGNGTQELSGILYHTGGTTVDGGTLRLNRGGVGFPGLGATGQFAAPSTVTVNGGATLELANIWVTGDGLANKVVVNEGGTLAFVGNDNYLGNIELTGGAITTAGGLHPWRTGNWGDGVIETHASALSSTIDGSLTFVRTASATQTTFDVADGAAADDLIMSARIYDHPGNYAGMALVKDGAGTMVLNSTGSNTMAGPVNVDQGTLRLAVNRGFNQGYFQNVDNKVYNIADGATLELAGDWVSRSNSTYNIHGGTLVGNAPGGDVNYINLLNFDTSPGTVGGSQGIRTGYFFDPTWTVGAAASGSTIATPVGLVDSAATTALTLNVADGGAASDLTISGAISDVAGYPGLGLTKTGAGTLTLGANNTYTGATTVSDGTLALQGTYASTSYTIDPGAVLELNVASGTTNYAAATFSGGGTLRKTGGGTAQWPSTSATFALDSGALIDVQGGTFIGGSYANENWTANASDLNVAGGALFNGVEANVRVGALTGDGEIRSGYPGAGYSTFTFGVGDASGTFGGILTHNHGVGWGHYTKTGTGTQTFTGTIRQIANGAGTGMTISDGTVEIAGLGTFEGGSWSNALINNGTFHYNSTVDNTMTGVISGTGALVKGNTSTLTLNGNNTYTGPTTINGGVLVLNNPSGGAYTYIGGDIHINNGSTLRISKTGHNQYWFNGKSFIFDSTGGGTIDTTSGLNFVVYGGSTVATNGGAQDSIVGTSGINLHAGHTLNFDVASGIGPVDLDVSAPLWNSGGIHKTGDGVLRLSANNTYTGATTIDGGTLVLQGGGSAYTYTGGNIYINNGSTLQVSPGSNNQYWFNNKNFIFDSNGGGTIDTTSGLNFVVYGGSTVTTNGGAQDSIVGTSGINLHAGHTLNFDVASGADPVDLDVASRLWNSGGVNKTGDGVLLFSANNTYTGATTVNDGTLVLQGTYASTSHSIAPGAVLELNVASGITEYGSTTFSGGGTLRKTGGGTARWPSTAATFALGSGALIDVQEGTFVGGSYANENWTNNFSDLNVALGATFNGVEANVRVDVLTGQGTITSGYGGAGYQNFTFGVDNGDGTFDGVLANGSVAGNYVKAGTGTQVLAGNSTYTGTTTVAEGTLLVTGSLGNTPTTVLGGAVLGGTGSIAGPVTVQALGTLAPDGDFATGTLDLMAGSTLAIDLNALDMFDQVLVTGGVGVGGARLALGLGYAPENGDSFIIVDNDGQTDAVSGFFADLEGNGARINASFGGQDYGFWIYYNGNDGNDITLTAVPEPATLTLLGLGGLAALIRRRRRS